MVLPREYLFLYNVDHIFERIGETLMGSAGHVFNRWERKEMGWKKKKRWYIGGSRLWVKNREEGQEAEVRRYWEKKEVVQYIERGRKKAVENRIAKEVCCCMKSLNFRKLNHDVISDSASMLSALLLLRIQAWKPHRVFKLFTRPIGGNWEFDSHGQPRRTTGPLKTLIAHQSYLHWIPAHTNIKGNEKGGCCCWGRLRE